MVDFLHTIKSGIFGLAIGDALGVPAEFMKREELDVNPVMGMSDGGIHCQPKGTWSDDTSMTLCLMESIVNTLGIHTNDIMDRFVEWIDDAAYTATGDVFDCGHTVAQAIFRYKDGTPAALCGGNKPNCNGNGSLMRILPMAYALYPKYGTDLTKYGRTMELVHKVSGLTHRHPLSQAVCGIYVNIATRLIDGEGIFDAISDAVERSICWYGRHERFYDIDEPLSGIADIVALKGRKRNDIQSGGYVIDTMEAALWCLLNTDSYRDCVLTAVNLGEDADTVAAVTGGLAGIFYEYESIPKDWIDVLASKEMIEKSCMKMAEYMKRELIVYGGKNVNR